MKKRIPSFKRLYVKCTAEINKLNIHFKYKKFTLEGGNFSLEDGQDIAKIIYKSLKQYSKNDFWGVGSDVDFAKEFFFGKAE